MKSIGFLAACVLALGACGGQAEQKHTEAKPSTASAVTTPASAPVSTPMATADMPQSCQQLLANIEKCVLKYEKTNAAEGASLRVELEQLRGQISSSTDRKALEQACTESNRQSAQLPATQC